MNITTIMLVPLSMAAQINKKNINLAAKKFAKTIESRIATTTTILLPELDLPHAEFLLDAGKINELLEEVAAIREDAIIKHNSLKHQQKSEKKNEVEKIAAVAANIPNTSTIFIFQGLPLLAKAPYAATLNYDIATALGASIVFVAGSNEVAPASKTSQHGNTLGTAMPEVPKLIPSCNIAAHPYRQKYSERVLGYILLGSKAKKESKTNKPGTITITPALINNTSTLVTFHQSQQSLPSSPIITPPLFRYKLIATARANQRRIVLPEGDEPRTLQAANICAERQLAQCILLGEKKSIVAAAQKLGIAALHPDIIIIEPKTAVNKYVEPLYAARRHKEVNMEDARKLLQDNIMLGTMMMHLDEADGMVAGALNTTAHTVRAPFQIIKTAPNAKIISSIFFMCLPEQVLVYGDCAINPDPTAAELADIAIQSAISAQRFGITPRIAMLSYSTGASGTGDSVSKVRAATTIVKELRPDLQVEGPLQYDAAIDPGVAKLKLPGSTIAGKANVFIFPDLNSGNISYKAVQRATGVVCIGPMLQGMRKPVNDLSRGCSVEDIVFTIALTAVQSR